MLNETLARHNVKNNQFIILCIVYSLYKHLKIISVQFQGISSISFCNKMFCGNEMTNVFILRKKEQSIFKLSK